MSIAHFVFLLYYDSKKTSLSIYLNSIQVFDLYLTIRFKISFLVFEIFGFKGVPLYVSVYGILMRFLSLTCESI
jgi:hypothetical protein